MSTTEMINHELAACWEMCCEAVGIDTDATAAEWRETYEDQRAQVRREADGAYVDGMGNTRKAIVKAIQDRAERLEEMA